MRFLFYSHDGYGLGHSCRNLAIARALLKACPKASVLLATGSDDLRRMSLPPGSEILKLPALRKVANERYAARFLAIPESDVRSLRARLLVGAVEAYKPDLLLVDKHPFGAGGELKVALEIHRENGGVAVLGLRDILDEPDTVRREWEPHGLPGRIVDGYDAVLVYGQQHVFDPVAAYGFPAALERRTRFCGYVSEDPGPASGGVLPPGLIHREHAGKPLVLATVGGGEDGFPLLKLFLQAAAGRAWAAVAVTGPMMPAHQVEVLRRLAKAGDVCCHTFVPGLQAAYGTAGVVVCMGGYNTLAQTLSAGVPVVCVPRTQPRLEQRVRASAFAARGLLQHVSMEGLRVSAFRAEIEAALAVCRTERAARIQNELEFDGAARAAERLLETAGHARVARVSSRTPRNPRVVSLSSVGTTV